MCSLVGLCHCNVTTAMEHILVSRMDGHIAATNVSNLPDGIRGCLPLLDKNTAATNSEELKLGVESVVTLGGGPVVCNPKEIIEIMGSSKIWVEEMLELIPYFTTIKLSAKSRFCAISMAQIFLQLSPPRIEAQGVDREESLTQFLDRTLLCSFFLTIVLLIV